MLRIDHLSKNYHSVPALRDISLDIQSGEILGVLGPNGAGKTTLFKIITGSLAADSGTIRPTQSGWPAIGYKPERLFFPEGMSVMQYLRTMAALSNIPATRVNKTITPIIERVGLHDVSRRKIRHLSQGMRQRLGLAQALIGDAPLLVLDEPTDGLDPLGQSEVLACIQELHASGKTIVMSSHQLGEITTVCTHLVILNRGRLIYRNSLADALADRPRAQIHVDKDLAPVKDLLHSLDANVVAEGTTVKLRDDATVIRRQILSILLASGYDILQIERRRATLAEIYSEVTQ